MITKSLYEGFVRARNSNQRLLAILIDPDKISPSQLSKLLHRLPDATTHLFVGGSEVAKGATDAVVDRLRMLGKHPIVLFPGDYQQLTNKADGLLFLSLLSGRNPEYLIEQQRKAVPYLSKSTMAILPTAYLLIDGGSESAVARVTQTAPISQHDIETIVHTAKAAEYMGKKLIYLEAGSGATHPVSPEIIKAVYELVSIPIIVGGGIRTQKQLEQAYSAGATMVVIGTALEEKVL